LADFGLNENKFVQSNCISYQLKDLISNISTEIQSKTSKFDENQFDTNLDSQNEISFEALEAKLIIKAKMEFEKSQKMQEEDDTLNLNELTVEQKEILQNLLLASIADLENCCENCLSTYKDISNYINSKALEFNQLNEYLERLNNYEQIISQNGEHFEKLPPDPDSFLDYDYRENYCDGNLI
jgi:hypothetical protein